MIRLILIFLIIFLIVRAFIIAGAKEESLDKDPEPEGKKIKSHNGIPKGIGEYIDYEEIEK